MGGLQACATSSSTRKPLDECPVYVVGAARTPLGAFGGSLSHLSATELGSVAIKAAVERAGVPPEAVEEVFMGNVCSANLGQAPARQAALRAGLPLGTDCTTVNKVCSSGLKAIMLGAQSIVGGPNSLVVAGGMESMSNIPHYAPAARKGTRLGHATLLDGLLVDGLWDAFHDVHMGDCAEACADKYRISRAEQDAHALTSWQRATEAAAQGLTAGEIVPVEVPGSKGGAVKLVTQDEALAKMNPDKLRKLQPFFRASGGTVTAGNSSPLTDGAAAVVLASEEAVRRYGLKGGGYGGGGGGGHAELVLGRIRGFGDAAQDPREFTTAPTLAIPKALDHAGLAMQDVDIWEINEAFSVVDLVNQKLLQLDPERVNVFGGAVALGHPIGASGARLLVTLLNVLQQRQGRVGVAAICNGGGGASALVLERVDGQLPALDGAAANGSSSLEDGSPSGSRL
ncbi:hypothetical protein N2152v2_001999 [Parachlorella kessleri]